MAGLGGGYASPMTVLAFAGPSPGWQAVLYVIAFVCFVLAALRVRWVVEFVAAGLAFAVLVLAWQALARA